MYTQKSAGQNHVGRRVTVWAFVITFFASVLFLFLITMIIIVIPVTVIVIIMK